MTTAPASARRQMLRGARFALHLITVVLVVVTTARAGIAGELLPVLLAAAVYLAWYGAGAGFAHKRAAVWWMLGLLAIWIGMLALSAEFVWLAFPLLLLAGHVLRLPWSLGFVAVVLVASIVAPMLHPGGATRNLARPPHRAARRGRLRLRGVARLRRDVARCGRAGATHRLDAARTA